MNLAEFCTHMPCSELVGSLVVTMSLVFRGWEDTEAPHAAQETKGPTQLHVLFKKQVRHICQAAESPCQPLLAACCLATQPLRGLVSPFPATQSAALDRSVFSNETAQESWQRKRFDRTFRMNMKLVHFILPTDGIHWQQRCSVT